HWPRARPGQALPAHRRGRDRRGCGVSGYTPTTDEIRNVWGEFSEYGGLTNRTSGGSLIDARYAEFDRWMRSEREQQARFWMRVTKDYHWLWTGETAPNGYGRADTTEETTT